MNTHTAGNTFFSPLKCCLRIAVVFTITIFLHGCAGNDTSKTIVHKERPTTRHESKWDGAKSFQVKEYNVSIGLLNDDKNLYVRLVTNDNGIRQIMTTSGCTIWVDAAGGMAKIYGIHSPSIKQSEAAGQPTRLPVPNGQDEKSYATPDQQPPQVLEIVSNGGEECKQITISEARSLGIEAIINNTSRYLTYDLTIPNTEIIAHHGTPMSRFPQSIAIALEIEGVTPAAGSRSEMGSPGGGEQRGQGRMGGDVRGGGGMGRGDKPENIERTGSHGPGAKETLEEWFIVDL